MSETIASSTLFGTPSAVLQTLFNTIRIRVPGLTDEQMQLELVQAMREFFSESTVWRESGTVTIAEPNDVIGLLQWRAGAEVIFPYLVKWNGIPLVAMAAASDFALQQYSTPRGFIYDMNKNITLVPQPDNTGGTLHIYVSLQPMLVAPVVPDNQLAVWFEGILDTVLGRLYMQPTKPFSNNALGILHSKKSRAWINKARDTANRGFAGGAPQWRFPYFARGSGGNFWGQGGGVST